MAINGSVNSTKLDQRSYPAIKPQQWHKVTACDYSNRLSTEYLFLSYRSKENFKFDYANYNP